MARSCPPVGFCKVETLCQCECGHHDPVLAAAIDLHEFPVLRRRLRRHALGRQPHFAAIPDSDRPCDGWLCLRGRIPCWAGYGCQETRRLSPRRGVGVVLVFWRGSVACAHVLGVRRNYHRLADDGLRCAPRRTGLFILYGPDPAAFGGPVHVGWYLHRRDANP